jgi:peptide/nickel transport system permease protein
MLTYLARRIALGCIILGVVAVLLFCMTHLIPGDPAIVALGPHSTPAMRAAFRSAMGLDLPIMAQFRLFAFRLLRGDLGVDIWSRRPVAAMIGDVLPYTMILAVTSLAWSGALGIVLGCISVFYRGRWIDGVLGMLSAGMIAVPSFVVALCALLIFAVTLHWLPAIGAGEPGDPRSEIAALVLPSLAIGLGWVGYIGRILRAAMIEAMGEPYVRTLRAFGVAEPVIVARFALKQGVLAVIAIISAGFGGLLTGSVFAEIVFSRPGIGKLTYDAVMTRNYPVVTGAILVSAGLYVACMIAADIVTALVDPRIRAGL